MGTAEKIRILLVKRGNIPERELAKRLGVYPQSLSKQLQRDDFRESDLQNIATALGCTFDSKFIMNDTGEVI